MEAFGGNVWAVRFQGCIGIYILHNGTWHTWENPAKTILEAGVPLDTSLSTIACTSADKYHVCLFFSGCDCILVFSFQLLSLTWNITCWSLQLCHITCIWVIHVEPTAKYVKILQPTYLINIFYCGFLPAIHFQMFQFRNFVHTRIYVALWATLKRKEKKFLQLGQKRP